MARGCKPLKNALFVSAALFAGLKLCLAHASQSHCFDALFPATAYKKVFDASMSVESGIADISHNPLPDSHKVFLQDVIVGRIVRLFFLMRVLREQHQAGGLDSNDQEYLVALLTGITASYKAFMTQEIALAGALLTDSTCMLKQLR